MPFGYRWQLVYFGKWALGDMWSDRLVSGSCISSSIHFGIDYTLECMRCI